MTNWRQLWVLEMWDELLEEWVATQNVEFSRNDVRELAVASRGCGERVRIRKYVPED
jgi:hypothetical protein